MQHHDSNYSDPYAQAPAYPAQQQSYPPQQSEYPDYSQHNANVYPPNAPYTEENRKSYHSLGNNAGFHPNESTEKMVEPDQGFIGGTERERPGRQRQMGDVPVSWAGMGPPPRSTGILRMWRKEERGSQWIRVRNGAVLPSWSQLTLQGNGVSTTLRWFVCVVTFAVLIILTLALSIALARASTLSSFHALTPVVHSAAKCHLSWRQPGCFTRVGCQWLTADQFRSGLEVRISMPAGRSLKGATVCLIRIGSASISNKSQRPPSTLCPESSIHSAAAHSTISTSKVTLTRHSTSRLLSSKSRPRGRGDDLTRSVTLLPTMITGKS